MLKSRTLLRLLVALLVPSLACTLGGGGASVLPATDTPRAAVPTASRATEEGPEPSAPTATPSGQPAFFTLDLNPSDQEGLEMRADEIFQALTNAGGEVDRGVLLEAYADLASYEHVGGEWRAAGPAPIEELYDGPDTGYIPTSGRTDSFLIDPRDNNVVYASVGVGGIWKTTDAGETWVSLTDTQVPLNYGLIVMHPDNPDYLYALLGQFDGQIASVYGYLANGIMRSKDAGTTWELLGQDVFLAASVTALVWDADGTMYASSGQDRVYMAPPDQTDFGVFKSTDDGDTWERLTSCEDWVPCHSDNPEITPFIGGFMDMDIGSDGTLFASVCQAVCKYSTTKLIRSQDAGETWDELDLSDAVAQFEDVYGWPIGDIGGEPMLHGFEIAISPFDPQFVVAGGGVTVDVDGDEESSSWLLRSHDGGDTWEMVESMEDYCAVGGISQQCYYDNVVEFDPAQENVLFVGGAAQDTTTWEYVRLVQRSDDGGDTWADLTPPVEGSRVHPDVHGIGFIPDQPDALWVGTDGGIFYTEDTTQEEPTWEFRGRGIGSLLFVDIGIGPTDGGYIIGGMQDNSCAFTTDGGETWQSTTCGGDGAYTAVDPFDPSIVYASNYPVWVFNVNEDGGVGKDYESGAWQTRTDGLDFDEYWPFRPPFTVDPNNEGRIYNHSVRVYRTDDRGETWEAISDYLVTADLAYITTLAVSYSDPDVLYAGTTESTVWMTPDGGDEWNDVSGDNFPPRPIRRVLIDPEDSNTAYVVFTGFDVQTPDTPGHIFRTTDGGESWDDISLNLPDAPLSSIAIDKRDGYAGVYVGGALGVWVLQDGSDQWLPYGTGMPFTLVTEIEINPETGVLVAGTWGRSVWVTDMP